MPGVLAEPPVELIVRHDDIARCDPLHIRYRLKGAVELSRIHRQRQPIGETGTRLDQVALLGIDDDAVGGKIPIALECRLLKLIQIEFHQVDAVGVAVEVSAGSEADVSTRFHPSAQHFTGNVRKQLRCA